MSHFISSRSRAALLFLVLSLVGYTAWSHLPPTTSLSASVVDFTSSQMVIEDFTSLGQSFGSDSDETAILSVRFPDSTGLGDLSSIQVNFSGTSTFQNAGQTSSFLDNLPNGLSLYLDQDGGGILDGGDVMKAINPNNNYTVNGPTTSYTMQISGNEPLVNGARYFIVISTDDVGVIHGQTLQATIPANGITTSGTSPTNTQVETYSMMMSVEHPEVVRVQMDGALDAPGTHVSVQFDQSLNPSGVDWAITDQELGKYSATYLVYAEDPDTWTSHSLGTGAFVEFSTVDVSNDRVIITLGTGSELQDGDQIWIWVQSAGANAYSQTPALVDSTAPQLSSIYLSVDAGSDGQATQQGDHLIFTFNEPMDPSTLQGGVLNRLTLSAGTLTTTMNPAVQWTAPNVFEVQLSAAQTNSVGATVSVANTVKDVAGNSVFNTNPLPTIQVVAAEAPAYVSFVDGDMSNWGISNEDIEVDWAAVEGIDHFNVYLLPSDEPFNSSTQNPINSTPLSGLATSFSGIDSSYYLGGDSRSNFETFSPYHYFESNIQYVAYVVGCNDVAETECSLPAESGAFTFSNESSFSDYGDYDSVNTDYYGDLGWTSTFVETTSPWNGATISTNYKVFGMVFSDQMDASTITSSTLTLTADGSPVAGTVTYDDAEWVAYFTATQNFSANANVVLTLDGALDAAGIPLSYTANFTAGSTSDSTAPEVLWTSPSDNVTGVDTLSSSIQISFNEPLDPTTVTVNNVTFSPSVSGELFYDPWNQSIVMEMNSTALQSNTEYTVTVSGSGVKDAAGNLLGSDYVFSFTTGAANTTEPTVTWYEFNPEGFELGFDLPMKESAAITSSNFTLVCDSAPVSLSAAAFEWDSYFNELYVEGVQLTEGAECTLTLSTNLKATNNVSVALADRTLIATVEAHSYGTDYYSAVEGDWFQVDEGYENMYDMPSVQFWNPMNAWPDSAIAGMTTTYTIEFPLTQALQDGNTVEVIWPTGFDMDSVTFPGDDYSNQDINGWTDGTPTFSVISNNVSTRTTTLTLDTDAAIGTNGDQLFFRLATVGNSSTASSVDNGGGYTVQIKTKDANGGVIEGPLTLSPFTLNEPGAGVATVQVLDEDTDQPIQNVVLSFYSYTFGQLELTTDINGEAEVTGIPVNSWGTDVSIWMDGNQAPDGYIPNWGSLYFYLTDGTPTATGTLYLNPADFTVTGTIAHPGIGTDGTSKVNVWASGPANWSQKTVTLDADGSTTYTVPIGDPGYYNVGVDKFYDYQSGGASKVDFVSPPPQPVQIDQGDSSVTLNLTLEAADKVISGTVTDDAGAGLPYTWVNVSSDHEKSDQWFWAGGSTDKSGNYSIAVGEGTFNVEAFVPGISGNFKKTVEVQANDTVVDVDFVLSKPDISLSGNVSDGSNGIEWANVSCHSTTGEFTNARTDVSGDFTFYVNAGTYTCDAYAFDYGSMPAATGVDVTSFVVSADTSGLNFEYDPEAFVQVEGTLVDSAGSPMSYVWLWADRVDDSTNEYLGYANGVVTGSDGTFSLRVQKNQAGESYNLAMWDWQYGHLILEAGIDASSADVALGTVSLPVVQTVTVTAAGIPASVSTLFVNFLNEDTGNWSWGDVNLSGGSGSTTVSLTDGDYTAFAWVPGLGEFQEDLTVSGSAASVAFDLSAVEIETVTVTVTDSLGAPVNAAYVEAFDPENDRYASTFTDSSGEATLSLVSGTYHLGSNQDGYISTGVEMDTTSATDYALTLTATDATITGRVLDAAGNPLAYAWVDAQSSDGSWAGTTSDGQGSFILDVVSDTEWDVVARDPSGSWGMRESIASDSSSIDVTMDQTLDHFVAVDPFTTSVDPTQDNVLTNEFAEMTISAGALGDDSNGVSLELSKTTAVPATDSAAPLGGFGVEVDATDSRNNSVINLSDDVVIELKYDKEQITALIENDIATAATLDAPLAYFNDTNGTWAVLPGATVSCAIQDDPGDEYLPVTMENFIENYDTYASTANDFTVSYIASTDHFTIFAPIVSGDSTAPAAPSGLTATAGNGQIVLDWTDSGEVDLLEYEVYRSTTSTVTQSSGTQVNTSSVTASTFTDTTVTNGTTYYYAVSAADTAGNESTLSSTANAVPSAGSTTVNTSSGVVGGSSSSSSSGATSDASDSDEASSEESESAEDAAEETSEESSEASTTSESEILIADFEATDYEGHWAESYIDQVIEMGIAHGTGENQFSPDATITRAQLVKMVVNAVGYQTPTRLEETSFSDVDPSAWYAGYVEVAKAQGILEGYEDGTFRPDQPITRAEALKVLIEGLLNKDIVLDSSQSLLFSFNLDENPFADVELSAWYAEYVLQAYVDEIVSGYGNGLFGPNDSMTRAEFSKVLVKSLEM